MTPFARIAGSAAVGIGTVALTYFWRQFPLRLALISGLAVAILVYSTLQAVTRLSNLYRRR